MSKRKLPSKAPSKKVIQLSAAEGWTPKARTDGFHIVFEKAGYRSIPVSASKKKIPKGTLRGIIKQMGIKRERCSEIWDSL
ncbi:MAG: type II toxin-antitoxin system HicA family toxin [Methanobacterium sp.]